MFGIENWTKLDSKINKILVSLLNIVLSNPHYPTCHKGLSSKLGYIIQSLPLKLVEALAKIFNLL